MGIYSTAVRVFIAVSVVISVLSGDIEYRSALLSLAGLYIFAYFLLPKTDNSKYILLFIDVLFISLGVYLTGYTVLSILVIPLISEFIRSPKDLTYFFSLSSVPIVLSMYVSNFTEFTFIPVIIAGISGIYGLYRTFINKEKEMKELKNEMENLYIKNISYQEVISQKDKILSVLQSLEKMRRENLPLKIWIYDINEVVASDGIIFFDFKNNKCFSTENTPCDKDILQYIDQPVKTFKNHQINRILNTPYVYAVTIDEGDYIHGIIVLLSKLKEIDPQIVQIIKDQLTLYFLENKSPQQNGSIRTSREEEGEGD